MFQFLWLSTKYSAVLRLSVDPIETLSLTWPVAKKKKMNKSYVFPSQLLWRYFYVTPKLYL